MRKAAHAIVRIVSGAAALTGVTLILALTSAFAFVIGGFSGNAVLPADCGIVFGAAVYGYAQPGPAIVRRISTAARLYREGKVKKLIVTGGVGRGGGVSLSEADVMRAQAVAYGVKSFDIITEGESHSTVENLALTQPLAKSCESVVGISDGYHLARIRLLASRTGWTGFQTVPADDRPGPFSEMRSVIREVFAFLYYGLHLDAFIPLRSAGSMAANPLQPLSGHAKLLT
jgi:uncharacterized SAM-binding protein YcdF (DUF218 family)